VRVAESSASVALTARCRCCKLEVYLDLATSAGWPAKISIVCCSSRTGFRSPDFAMTGIRPCAIDEYLAGDRRADSSNNRGSAARCRARPEKSHSPVYVVWAQLWDNYKHSLTLC
jgi:hypothetical protein